ncbi:MAG: type I restriction-modification system subunit M [Coriobacteriia bacterium]|nr:type I restriction-modification system subunit M [Coriobacteriia bacterium]
MPSIRQLEAQLWEAADNLRANSSLTSQQYCMPVLGLIFLRYAWGRYKRVSEQITQERARAAGRQAPIDSTDFTARGAMYLPESARYDHLLSLPENADTAKAVNAAMKAIMDENEQLAGILPDNYHELGNELLRETLRLFNHPELDRNDDDIIGRIYEYFLGKFAPAVASDDGIFFTPKSLVSMIMNIIEPTKGTMLDPACGSGGMFVSAADYVREHGGNPAESMVFYGHEKVEYNAKLALMNMAVHGMSSIGKIKSGDVANTFYNDTFSLDGKCDYVAANPPFNVDGIKAVPAIDAGRLPLGAPKINVKGNVSTSGANYLWINYFYSYLKNTGRAGFVMASSASDSNAEKHQRRKLVESDHVDVMFYVGNNFFYTKSLPCTLWFFDKGKPEELKGKTLFIDAQRYNTAVTTTHNAWSFWQVKNLTAIVWLYRGETEKYQGLLADYRAALISHIKYFEGKSKAAIRNAHDFESFVKAHVLMVDELDKRTVAAKKEVENLRKGQLKSRWVQYEAELGRLRRAIRIIEEAMWLTEKFGNGEYQDIPGLCKIASNDEIKGGQDADKSSWSLTPGAYVGVPPAECDGVDFRERMAEIHEELLQLQTQSNELMSTISKNFKEMNL